ncbi:hypothetical protein I7I48_10312 [Histoplasma ohiense]|nr:hypothetical protein I7I48_10312 [Histoplasma ohiense (nom. inval.)]
MMRCLTQNFRQRAFDFVQKRRRRDLRILASSEARIPPVGGFKILVLSLTRRGSIDGRLPSRYLYLFIYLYFQCIVVVRDFWGLIQSS